MEIILIILFFVFFSWGILRWKFFNVQGLSRNFLIVAFWTKLLAGVGLTLLYTYHYTDPTEADIYRYFNDSEHIHKALSENPKAYVKMMFFSDDDKDLMPYLDQMNNWFPELRTTLYNDNRTIIRINAFIRLFSFGQYYIHVLVFCMMAFYGLTFTYKAFHRYFVSKKWLFGVILFFTPSILFWSSGIMKEPPLLLVFGIALNLLNKVFQKRADWRHYLVLFLCFIFLIHLKFYVALLLIPAVTGYLWILLNKGPHPIIKALINYGVYFGIAVVWHTINWNWSLFTVLKWKRRDFIGLAELEQANSFIKTGELEDNPISFLIHLPMGLINAITRPHLAEASSLILLPNAIENIFILIFCAVCLIWLKRENLQKIGYFFIMFSVSLLAIIGMVTPIMGSLVRYKIPALPFFMMFFLLFLDTEKMKKHLPFMKSKI